MAALNNIERQDDEIQVLQSIFMSDFVDLRQENVWKTRIPPEIRLTLRPQLSMSGNDDSHTQIDLYLKCSSLYPDQIPEFRLENPKGISNQEMLILKEELEQQVNSLSGEVMILEMAQTVQKFLHAHNRPAPKSFYDEMMYNKQIQEEKLALDQQKRNEMIKRKEEKERQLIVEEIDKRHQALKIELKRKKDEEKQLEEVSVRKSTDHLPNLLDGVPISPILPVTFRKSSNIIPNGDKNLSGVTKRHRTAYYSQKKIVTNFLDVPVCNISTLENLFDVIDRCLSDHGLKWDNLDARVA